MAIQHTSLIESLVAAVLLVAPAAFAQPLGDGCHNPFRDGRTELTPQIAADIAVAPSEWADVQEILEDFAVVRGWSFDRRDAGNPDTYAVVQMSVCVEPGTYFSVLHHYVNPDAFPDEMDGPDLNDSMSLGIYQPQGGDGWRAPANDLLDRLEARFGDRISYSDERGRPVPRREAERPTSRAGDD